nr:valine--tRNA ligase [Streptococcus anginosus]
EADAELVAHAGVALAALRKVKSEAKVSQKTPILSASLTVAPELVAAVEAVRADLLEAAKVTGTFEVAAGAPSAAGT